MKLTLRKAVKGDVDLLFKWTNDKEVRVQSFTSKIYYLQVLFGLIRNKIIALLEYLLMHNIEGKV